MTNSEKAAYIRGLMEGMDLDPNAKETKLFNAIVDLLDDLSLSVEEMEDAYDELSGQVDEIDEDLGELEEEFYDIDEDEDEDDDDAWEDDEDECYYEVTCPKCGDTIELNEEMLDEGLACKERESRFAALLFLFARVNLGLAIICCLCYTF